MLCLVLRSVLSLRSLQSLCREQQTLFTFCMRGGDGIQNDHGHCCTIEVCKPEAMFWLLPTFESRTPCSGYCDYLCFVDEFSFCALRASIYMPNVSWHSPFRTCEYSRSTPVLRFGCERFVCAIGGAACCDNVLRKHFIINVCKHWWCLKLKTRETYVKTGFKVTPLLHSSLTVWWLGGTACLHSSKNLRNLIGVASAWFTMVHPMVQLSYKWQEIPGTQLGHFEQFSMATHRPGVGGWWWGSTSPRRHVVSPLEHEGRSPPNKGINLIKEKNHLPRIFGDKYTLEGMIIILIREIINDTPLEDEHGSPENNYIHPWKRVQSSAPNPSFSASSC